MSHHIMSIDKAIENREHQFFKFKNLGAKVIFRNHRFSRLELLVGKEGLGRFRKKHAIVFGIGGVGSYAAEALARAAVGQITLVDHDEVCATNVNRQLHALTDTVGQKKVTLMAERIRKINPHCEVEAIVKHYSREEGFAVEILDPENTVVLDCIDTVVAKVDLIAHCVRNKIDVISSMGAASRMDPSQVKVGYLSETQFDPLAKVMRTKLREQGVTTGVRAVYSTEVPLDPEAIIPGEEWQCICPTTNKEFGACSQKRMILGTISYLPPIFGLMMSADVIQKWLLGIDLRNRKSGGHIPTPKERERGSAVEV